MKCFLFFKYFLILMLLESILTLTDFNKDDLSKCMAISPTTQDDCLKSLFNTLLCCYFEMKEPYEGKICVAMNFSSRGLNNTNVTRVLPTNITLKGSYSCSGGYPYVHKFFMLFVIVFSLFLLK